MHNASEPVAVEKFSTEWVTWFEKLCSFLLPKIGPSVIRIEHVGSTSIPGMIAKPIIDLDIVIHISDSEDIKSRLETIGYVHQGDLGIPEREAFALSDLKLKKRQPPHHLYVCDIHSKELRRHIAFREYLREHPEDAMKYSELKVRLVKEHSGDRELYITGKDYLVKELVEKSVSWYNNQNR